MSASERLDVAGRAEGQGFSASQRSRLLQKLSRLDTPDIAANRVVTARVGD